MKGCSVVIIILVLACVVLFITNPPMEDHKQALFDTLRTAASQGGMVSGILGNLGVGIVEELNVLPFTYENYLLFSTLSLDGEMLSIGFLGNVFILQ